MALDVTDIRYANVPWADAEPFLTAEGDLLFTRYSGNPEYVGACARVPRMIEPVLHPDKLIRVVVDRDRVEPAFMELACSAGVTRDEIRARRKTTAGQVGIAGGQLRAVRLPVPPLEDQRRIVERAQAQLSALNSLRLAIERAHRRSVSLRRSILDLAFRGELIAQDPSDEASSVLLKRIREERAAAQSRPRRRRVGT
jgi:type I restriction enzyme S subunit